MQSILVPHHDRDKATLRRFCPAAVKRATPLSRRVGQDVLLSTVCDTIHSVIDMDIKK